MVEFLLNKKAVLSLDLERGEIASVLYNGKQINAGRVPMFSVKLREKTGEAFVVSALDCSFMAYADGVASYASIFFDIEIAIKQADSGLIFRANIQNKTDAMLEWVELGSFSVCKKLKDEEEGMGEIYYPYNEGCKVTDMAYRESMPFRYAEPEYPSKNVYSIFPNMVFAQFIAYTVGGYGIYLGMHDEERTTKHIDFCYTNDGIKIFTRAFCDVGYGQDYAMPFDCVFELFEGEWYQAADIYYEWFAAHTPMQLKKIKDNKDLPSWYHQSPLIVTYPVRGLHDTDTTPNGLYPYVNAIPLLEEIASKADSKVMALLMHWESTAPWAPPYHWPPYGGVEEFEAFADAMHKKDMLVGLYESGFGWTQKSNVVGSYQMQQAFEEQGIATALCAGPNGELKSTICLAQREGYDFCPASEKTKGIFKEEIDKVCSANIDYLQALDQNHGGSPYFCYSKEHGHVPAPGKWQQIETNKLLSSIDRKGVLLGCESAAAEPFLANLQFSDNRYELNYYLGEPIPLYSYLYHEYVNNFMGNQICAMLEKKENNFTYRLAYSFTAGDMLTVIMDGKGELQYAWCDYTPPVSLKVDKENALRFIKTLNAWRNKGGKEFLHMGKMVAPSKIVCGKEKFLLEDGKTSLVVDSALTVAYEYEGKRAQFLVNYNLYPVEVVLDGNYDAYTDSDLQNCIADTAAITLSPLSVVMLRKKDKTL